MEKLYDYSLFVLWPLVSSLTKFHLRGRSAKELSKSLIVSNQTTFPAIILASELDEHQILKQFGPLLWEEARSSHEEKPANEDIERALEAAWSVVPLPKNIPKPDLASRIREDQKDEWN